MVCSFTVMQRQNIWVKTGRVLCTAGWLVVWRQGNCMQYHIKLCNNWFRYFCPKLFGILISNSYHMHVIDEQTDRPRSIVNSSFIYGIIIIIIISELKGSSSTSEPPQPISSRIYLTAWQKRLQTEKNLKHCPVNHSKRASQQHRSPS